MTVLVLAASVLAGCTSVPAPAEELRANDAPANGTVREFHLYVSEAVPLQPLEGKSVLAFGFALSPEGPWSIPGPELRVRQGDTVRAWLHSVGIGHTIHWHGLKLPWAMDGVPFMTQTIAAGNNTYLYEFVARESGTYWYHCHVDAPSHIDYGMFGPLIVEPADPAQDPPFDREATLMLHEIDSVLFAAVNAVFLGETEELGNRPSNPADAAGALANMARGMYDFIPAVAAATAGDENLSTALGSAGPRDHYPAFSLRYRPQYDTFMINGKSFPETEPVYIRTGETLRLRLVNAGQLVHTMHLHGTHMLVTHKDGYLLPEGARFWADTLVIGPGERYDAYVVGDNPGMWDFHDHSGAWGWGAYAANDHAFPGGMATMLVYEDFTYAQLPEPEPERGWRSGDYAAFAPRYPGVAPPDLHRH